MMKQSPTSQSYASSITRIAVTQICQSVGYQASQTPALDALTDIATRYLVAIASSASASSASASRTQSNVFDVVAALEDLEAVQGFTGCSRPTPGCVLKSSLFIDLERFIVFTDEIPFAKPLERRPAGDHNTRASGEKDSVRPNHVPRWLPTMPVIGIEERGRGRWEEEEGRIQAREKREADKERVRKGGGLGKTGGEKRRVIMRFNKRLETVKNKSL